MSNIVSSTIFCARNIDKAENQDKVGRWAVAVGQGKKVIDYVRTLDNELGKNTNALIHDIKVVSEQEKLLEYTGKAINFASKKVNPLIIMSSGLDVLTAEDKKSALVKNTTALSAMFAVEHLMKNHLDDVTKIKGIDKVAKKVAEFGMKHNCEGKLGALIHGVAFVVGSCTAYSVGDKFGDLILNKTDAKKGKAENKDTEIAKKTDLEPKSTAKETEAPAA